jgi:hypothetical protein
MVSWLTFIQSAPEFAGTVRTRLEAGPYALLGSIRADGHPRISGVIVTFSDTELWLGMPRESVKVSDLERDPRMSLHSSVSASPTLEGDAKLHGRAEPVAERESEFERFLALLSHDVRPGTLSLFRIDVVDASQVRLSETRDHHIIESWRAGQLGTRTRIDHP